MDENKEIIDYIKEGFELKKSNSYKQAIEMFYKALEHDSNNIEILYQLGELYYLLKNNERSIHYLEQVVRVNNKHLESLKLLFEIFTQEKKYDLAVEYANKIIEIEPTPKNITITIKLYEELYDIEKIKSFENTDSPEIKLALAKAYYELKEPDYAMIMAQGVLNETPDNEDAKLILGKVYFDKNEIEKSREIFDTFRKDNTNPEVLNFFGLFETEDLNFSEAIKYFSKAVNLDSENAVYYFNLGNAYFFNGWSNEAVIAYSKAIKYAPENLDYRYSLAYLYYKTKNFKKCESEIKYILSEDENHYKTRVIEALLKYEKKDYLGAEKILVTNIKANAKDDFTYLSLVKVYKMLEKYDKAEETIKKVITKNPDNMDYNCELATIYLKENKYRDVLNLIEKVLKKNENFISAYIIGAECAFQMEKYEKCKEYAQKAISLDINNAAGYYWLGKIREKENDMTEANECLKRAIVNDLTNAFYYAEMSKLHKSVGNIKTALDYMKEAADIDGSSEYKAECAELAVLQRRNLNKTLKNLSPKQK